MGYKNYNEDMNTYMKQRWTKRRAAAVEFLGGECKGCGWKEELDFDHIDPATKVMAIARASSRSETFFWTEVKKCQLLCKPCHLEKSAADLRKKRKPS
jgi:hypothetical protein